MYLERLAQKILAEYSVGLCNNPPCAIPIENIIEWYGLTLEFQYLRKNRRILGKVFFDATVEAVYDMEQMKYTLFPVRAGTILIDASLCESDESSRLLRLLEACGLAHWLLYNNMNVDEKMPKAITLNPIVYETTRINTLSTALLMPRNMVERCFDQMYKDIDPQELIYAMASVFQVSLQAMRIRLINCCLL